MQVFTVLGNYISGVLTVLDEGNQCMLRYSKRIYREVDLDCSAGEKKSLEKALKENNCASIDEFIAQLDEVDTAYEKLAARHKK